MTTFKSGQKVRIKAEFCDPGQSDIIHVITEDEDGGRTSITPDRGQGFDEMRIKPVERIEANMLEVA